MTAHDCARWRFECCQLKFVVGTSTANRFKIIPDMINENTKMKFVRRKIEIVLDLIQIKNGKFNNIN